MSQGKMKHKIASDLSQKISLEKEKNQLKNFIFDLKNLEDSSKALRSFVKLGTSEEDYELLKKAYKESEIEILDHNEKLKKRIVGKMTYFVQRIISWYAFFKRENQFLNLMKNFHVSPFAISSDGRNTIHLLALENNPDMLELVLLPQYKFKKFGFRLKLKLKFSRRKFNLGEALSMASGFGVNTALHHSALRDHFKCFEILKNYGAKLDVVNYRGWTPLQLSSSKVKYFREFRDQKKLKEMNELVLDQKVNKLTCSYKTLLKHNSNYLYCIVSVADSINPKNTTVYKQLLAIKNQYKTRGKLTIDVVEGYDNFDFKNFNFSKISVEDFDKKLSKNHYVYKIKMNKNLAESIADEMGVRVYNQRHRYHTTFIQENSKYYEPLRDVQKQQILIYIIMQEFDIFKFQTQKLILDHFPLHHFRYRQYIALYWKRYFWATILGSLRVGKRAVGFRALTQIAFYQGIQNGFYFGFLIQLTSFMFPLAIIGLGFYIYSFFDENGSDNMFLPLVAVLSGIWLTLFIENWKRREKHLAYNFDTLDNSKNEKKRINYTGNYIVNQISKDVDKFDSFTVFKRRLIVTDLNYFLG